MVQTKILIVDDEQAILDSLQGIFVDEGFIVETALSAELAMAILKKDACFHVILLDIWMEGMDGLQFLEWLKNHHSKIPVIMMSGHGNIETAVKATKIGAYDFIDKPLSLEKLLLTVSHAIREFSLAKENEDLKKNSFSKDYEIIGKSKEIQAIISEIELVAPSEGWVLIHGENGTGKELVARQIHLKSMRKQKAFIEMNCAAIPEELIESELFGHEKGSFTGATTQKIGKFDQANGGTLFLDEIADMSLKTQAKILRILQEQRFERVGGTEFIEVDVRIIAASNKDLQEEIDKNNFREDLFYRLNVIPMEIPPLRKRKGDIPILVNHFLKTYAIEQHYTLKKISSKAMKALEEYHWPGNIRELKNIVERMVIMVKEKEILLEHVPISIRKQTSENINLNEFPDSLKEAKEIFEKKFIHEMLERNQWNVSKTSETIQLERSHLHKKIKQLNITIPKSEK